MMQTNWQVRAAADELSVAAQLVDIIHCYAPESHDLNIAKKEIINRQKEIGIEKKLIRENLRKYKPQIRIYEEMKQLEARAYLYDLAGMNEYESEYLKYKELADRLWEKYGKRIGDVADFCENQNSQLAYATAQKEELSLQYKALIGYENHQIRGIHEGMQLFDAIGHSMAKREAGFGVFTSRLVYLTADENKDIKLRVMTTPDIVEGKNTVSTVITVLDSNGEEIERISSAELSARKFNSGINEMKYKYGLITCHVSEETQSNTSKSVRKDEDDVEIITRRKSR